MGRDGTTDRADGGDGLHRASFARRALGPGRPGARAAAPARGGAGGGEQRGGGRSRPADEHGRRPQRRRCRGAFGGSRPRHVRRAGGRFPQLEHRGDAQARRGGPAGEGGTLRVPVVDPCAVRPQCRDPAHRRGCAGPDRSLRPLEARGRRGAGRDRARLGGVAPGARLRRGREGQHGRTPPARPLPLPAAAGEPDGPPLAGLAGEPRRRRGGGARCAGPDRPPADRGRSRSPHPARDDRRDALRPRPRARPAALPHPADRPRLPHHRTAGGVRPPLRLARRPRRWVGSLGWQPVQTTRDGLAALARAGG